MHAATPDPRTAPDLSPIAPREVGWSSDRLAVAQRHAEQIESAAVLVVVRGRVVASWGDPARKINVRSIRKSFLSALIGQCVAAGAIDPTATLEQLGVDETPPLTAAEKQATVLDLMTSRSGVYRPAELEMAQIATQRPSPGSHRPGSWFSARWQSTSRADQPSTSPSGRTRPSTSRPARVRSASTRSRVEPTRAC